ncbi:MAG: hypothetical protein R3F24_04795 [Gammaproteobacteria bacterium]
MARIIYSSPIYDKLSVGPSAVTGRGLFAGCVIPARAKIGEFEGEIITIREARRRAKGRRVVAIVELEWKAIDATDTHRGFPLYQSFLRTKHLHAVSGESSRVLCLAPDCHW